MEEKKEEQKLEIKKEEQKLEIKKEEQKLEIKKEEQKLGTKKGVLAINKQAKNEQRELAKFYLTPRIYQYQNITSLDKVTIGEIADILEEYKILYDENQKLYELLNTIKNPTNK
ncbi:hypothetical protein M0811_13302 [Anaeramoeba ignava]|uniref:Uncharacterized protein n=1 Tax=Anaeramoeba ignava TaxID=1746090 RepID=A0A9Q0L6A4_ANAIG|nr:hypothetical protein M0811_13302 [Anaeramoeba ignava]